jgi:hypothetical protein
MLFLAFFSFPARLFTTLLQGLPIFVARRYVFTTPSSVIILADCFYLSYGFLNVILYRYTRPYLLPRRMDSVDDQSVIVLNAEVANSQNHFTSSGFVGSVPRIYIKDESTGDGVTNIENDI